MVSTAKMTERSTTRRKSVAANVEDANERTLAEWTTLAKKAGTDVDAPAARRMRRAYELAARAKPAAKKA